MIISPKHPKMNVLHFPSGEQSTSNTLSFLLRELSNRYIPYLTPEKFNAHISWHAGSSSTENLRAWLGVPPDQYHRLPLVVLEL